jgi:hypothetical protein
MSSLPFNNGQDLFLQILPALKENLMADSFELEQLKYIWVIPR